MIRPNNALFWLLVTVLAAAVIVVVIRPVRQLFGSVIWDPLLVPIYTNSLGSISLRGLLCGALVLGLLAIPFLLSPLWNAIGALDTMALAMARSYYSKRFIRYRVDRHPRADIDPYARLRSVMRYAAYPFRFVRPIPVLGDAYGLVADDKPSPRVALLLINRIHESSYFMAPQATQNETAKMQQRWAVAVVSMQALAAHVLAGAGTLDPLAADRRAAAG